MNKPLLYQDPVMNHEPFRKTQWNVTGFVAGTSLEFHYELGPCSRRQTLGYTRNKSTIHVAIVMFPKIGVPPNHPF